MNQPHHEHIDTAFLQLSFAIKLWHFLDAHPIDKELFDIDLTIQDPGNVVCLPSREFHTYKDLQLAAENHISLAFGVAAIVLWEAIREHAGLLPAMLNPSDSRKHLIASLCYMIRCCFAHGPVAPCWKIKKEKYKRQYAIFTHVEPISLKELDGQPFAYESINGYETLWLLRNAAAGEGLL